MIFSLNSLLSNRQAITADAASTNVIDLGVSALPSKRDQGFGVKIPFLCQIVESFNTLTSIRIVLQGSNDVAFGSGVDTIAEQTIPLADAVIGRRFFLDLIPQGTTKRYVRMFYDITGTAPTLGRITAGVIPSCHQTN